MMRTKAQPTIVAHRGFSGAFPENTMHAFKESIPFADMIELDARVTVDDKIIIMHDAQLARTTNGTGFARKKKWRGYIENLDAGGGEHVATLDKVLRFAKKEKIKLNIELKQSARGFVQACIDLVKKHKMTRCVLFSSFNKAAIAYVKEIAPTLKTYMIYDWIRKEHSEFVTELLRTAREGKIDGVVFNQRLIAQLGEPALKKITRTRLPIGVYTVNSEKKMREFLDNPHISLIITNHPDRLYALIHRSLPSKS